MTRLRLGMVGGGEGAFIGAVHRMAAALDGDWQLVAGAFSPDAGRNTHTGAQIGLDPQRVYPSLDAMIAGERALPADERIDALAVVTPNHLHAPMAIAALEAGFAVLCEKPMAMNVAEAKAIAAAAEASGSRFALAFTYSGYPLIEEARLRVARGDFGAIRLVQVEYLQGWLSLPIDNDGNRQAAWRTDPARAGMGGCLGDIGTHAFHLAEHVSGLSVESVSADIATHVHGRRLDDDVSALLRFVGGARGVLKASQVAAGEENGLRLRIHGERGGLDWAQMEPNTLTLRWLDRPAEVVRTGGPGLHDGIAALTRTPAGHPEGYIEAFANLYRAFAAAIRGDGDRRFPGVVDGLRTMRFIEAVIANAHADRKWTPIDPGETE
ncbi:Gfo/Idh/MocA family protein [Sphingomonas sp. CFBP 8760]|uniref:Gfo/Idh/MocA family protein n=1 Tax=Sphingomonas sp. CFBP 8760 TaxID=2775282 RepID=UPI001783584A|nr:Gfo/Idh/MocA family oxidoreductase [Sphingomonas sp. CFBP 8760]MBD8545131.1 Gfo/Idh/MocA family oxidoreductase [Sphingomonas sp. CFBP 8760]